MKRREFLQDAGLAATALLLGGPGCRSLRSPTANGLNVVLILSDTLRADHLGCYGAPRSLTPNVDALAGRGCTFLNAMSSSPATGPAHASLMTGTYQPRHGVMLNEGRMRDDLATLAEGLDLAGYDTAAVISNPVLSRRTGLGVDRGFALYDDVMPRLERNRGKPFRAAPESTAAVLEWLRQKRDRPFFLWVHLMEPHGPYEVPDAAWLDKVGVVDPLPTDPAALPVLDTNRGPGGIPKYQVLGDERAPASYRARYAARVGYVDHHVGQILDAVHRGHLDDRTVIVFMSDHGELLGERDHYFQHGVTLLRAVLQIPLVISGPGIVANGRVAEIVGITDVLPSLLDMLDLRWDRLADQIEGRSFAPRLRGRGTAGDDAPRYAFCQYDHEAAIMLGRWKYTLSGETRPAERLTDLDADRLDTSDLSTSRPETASDLRARLAGVLSRAPGLFERGAGRHRELNEEDRERLRSLGYLQ